MEQENTTVSTTNATTATNGTENNSTAQQAVNYEAEYKKQLLEIDRLREAMKKSNSENAEYKRKEREKMSEDEKQAQDLKELLDSKKALEEELASLKLRSEFSTNGFTAKEIDSLIEANFSASSIKSLIEERQKEWEKSFKLKTIKENTPAHSVQTNQKQEEESKGATLAKQRYANNAQTIKDFYKK